jgi:predicted HicB family RNase H-like nuclease
MTTMTHDGYQAVVEFDEEAGLFHGEVIGLRDVITFQGKSVAELKRAFRESINDYLAFCKSRGEAPEKPFSGHFMVRTDAATHRRAALLAKRAGVSLNAWVNEALSSASMGATSEIRPPRISAMDRRASHSGAKR